MPPFPRRFLALPLAAALAVPLAGCMLGPEYQRPDTDLPAAFTQPHGATVDWPSVDWWRGFNTAELDGLIDRANAYNFDLDAAAARIVQADAQVRISGAPLLPSFSFGPSASYNHYSGTGSGSKGNSFSSGGGGAFDTRNYQLTGAFASYEVDLWGRVRAELQAAQATALGSRFDRDTVALGVVTSVAQTYFQALGYQDRLRTAQDNLRDSETILTAIQARRAAGTASDLDVAQQLSLVQQQRANIPALTSSYEQSVIALGILVGTAPENIRIHGNTLNDLSLPVPVPGMPSALVERRPDIAFAEQQLVAANADIRAARAAFFPSLSLTASGGWQSIALSTLTGPGAAFASVAGGLTQPIFNNGLLSGQLEQAKGRQQELVADYRKAVVQALTDVETALAALRYATEQEALERDAVDAARRAATISRAQMLAGTIDITTLLQTETTLYNAEDALTQIRLARVLNLVSLYKALGGGWQQTPAAGAT